MQFIVFLIVFLSSITFAEKSDSIRVELCVKKIDGQEECSTQDYSLRKKTDQVEILFPESGSVLPAGTISVHWTIGGHQQDSLNHEIIEVGKNVIIRNAGDTSAQSLADTIFVEGASLRNLVSVELEDPLQLQQVHTEKAQINGNEFIQLEWGVTPFGESEPLWLGENGEWHVDPSDADNYLKLHFHLESPLIQSLRNGNQIAEGSCFYNPLKQWEVLGGMLRIFDTQGQLVLEESLAKAIYQDLPLESPDTEISFFLRLPFFARGLYSQGGTKLGTGVYLIGVDLTGETVRKTCNGPLRVPFGYKGLLKMGLKR